MAQGKNASCPSEAQKTEAEDRNLWHDLHGGFGERVGGHHVEENRKPSPGLSCQLEILQT